MTVGSTVPAGLGASILLLLVSLYGLGGWDIVNGPIRQNGPIHGSVNPFDIDSFNRWTFAWAFEFLLLSFLKFGALLFLAGLLFLAFCKCSS